LNAATRVAEGALLDYAWTGSQLDGSMVAALLAEQKTAQSADELLRFVQGGNADAEELRRRNAREGQPHRLHRGW
jgi:hypothetical protein